MTPSHGAAPAREIERRVELRMRRQDILRRPQPPHLWAVIDEAALRRPIGGRATMAADRLHHLLDTCASGRVTIQVLTFAVGGHAVGGAISMLRLPAPEVPGVIYLEQLTTALYPHTPAEIEYYRHVLNQLTLQAEPPDATPAILHQILAGLTQPAVARPPAAAGTGPGRPAQCDSARR